MTATILASIFVGWVVMIPLIIYPVWRILRRYGRSPALSLLLLVPVAGILVLAWYLALAPRRLEPAGAT